jgi:methyltransferase-like protein/trans-aconitate methyltransferase
MLPAPGSSYEDVPYEGFALYLTCPDHLAALARLFGAAPADVETCRVLELGCARGDNLIPMALSLPGARFVGIDLSPSQIATGQSTIAALGLKNIEIRAQNILDLDPDSGPFDFIIAHGVYSWVPEPVREKMLSFFAAALSPGGLAHVSYNVYPGWHMRIILRDLMLFHTRELTEVRARVEAGRAVVQGLVRLLANRDVPYARHLHENAEAVARHDQSYLAHEYLEDTNQPIYFHEFVDRASAHGLHYLSEAEYWTTADAQPPELFRTFGDSASGWLDREQLLDFIKGRAFRHAVLCHTEMSCSRTPSAEAIESLRITSMVRPARTDAALGPDGGEEFQTFRGEFALSTNDPVVRLALRVLDEARPRSLPFQSLWNRVQERLPSAAPAPGTDDLPAPSPQALAAALLGLLGHHIIELHVREPAFTTEVNTLPIGSPFARLQAAGATRVANLRHRMVQLSALDQFLLPRLDGRHDRALLLAALRDAVREGALTIQVQGRSIGNHAEAEPILARALDASLNQLAGTALLVG